MATIGCLNKDSSVRNTRKVTYAAHYLMAEILQELLRIKEPYDMIASHIQNDNHLWSRLQERERKRILKVADDESYSSFDIPLIYKVLKSLNTVPPPTNGWGQDPQISETSVGDDIERIKKIRNKFAHKGNCRITDIELTEWFSKFTDIAKRMENYLNKQKGIFTNKFLKLEMDSMDDDIRDSFLNTIKFMKDEVDQLRHEFDNSQINDAKLIEIDEWKKTDETFVPIDACKLIIQALKDNDVVTVYGISGIGKSVTIHHVALVLHEQRQFEIIPCHSLKDMESKFKRNESQLFVFDDVCGRYSAKQDEINSWLRYESVITRIVKEGKAKVIVSCRLLIFKEESFQRIGVLKKCSIEFTENLITLDQKRSIYKIYLDHDLMPEIENDIAKCDFFPLMCSLYKNHTEKDIVHFFNNPFDIYMSEFDNIKEDQNKVKYFTIILIVLCNGKLRFTSNRNNDYNAGNHEIYFQNLLEDCGISRETHKRDIMMHLDSLVGTFLKCDYYHNNVGKVMLVYRPLHAKLFDYMCHHCGLHFQNIIMKYANRSLLSRRTRLDSLVETEEAPIIISSENEEEFFFQILEDMLDKKSEEVHIFRSPQMKCDEYRKKLRMFLERYEDVLKSSLKDIRIARKVLFGILASSYLDMLQVAEQIVGSFISVLDLAYCTEKSALAKVKNMFRTINTASIIINNHRYTPLVCASYHGHIEIFKLLLSKGACVNSNRSHRQTTALIAAAAGNNSNFVDVILQNNELDINKVDNRKASPLMVACSVGNYSVVLSLVGKGAKLNDVDKCGQTALMFASRHGYFDIVQFLCDCRANINVQSRKRWTALMFSCKGGHTHIAGHLIEQGASVNQIGENGTTPLHIAAKQHFLDLCSLLLQNGANNDLIDDDAVFAITKLSEKEDNGATITDKRSNMKNENNIDKDETVDLPLVNEIEHENTHM